MYSQTYPDNLDGERFFVLHHPETEKFVRYCWNGLFFTNNIEEWLMFQESEMFEAQIIALSALDIEIQPAILEITPAEGDMCMFSLSFVEKVKDDE